MGGYFFMGNNSRGRMTYIDAMKGIAILLVVVTHSLMNADKNIDSNYAAIINFNAFVAVPSFFFINGYLYNHNHSLTPIKSIIKKFKVYYIPFVGFNLFFWLFHNAFVSLHMTTESLYDIKDYIKHFFVIFALHLESELNGPMWFLRVLLIMACMYICIDYLALKIDNKRTRYVVLTIVVILMYIAYSVKIVPTVMNMRKVFSNMIFFYAGVVIREFDLDKLIDKYKSVVFILGMVMLFITSIVSKSAIGQEKHLIDVPGQICGIVGIFALSMVPLVANSKMLQFLGNASLDIMCLHFLAFKLVSFILIMTRHLEIERLSELPVLRGTNGFDFLFYDLVALCICSLEYLLRTKVCNRFKYNNKY